MLLRLVKFGFVLGLFFWASGALLAENPLQVKTDKGKVEGAYTEDQKVRAFKGIPFAAPPVGDLRWKEPQPASKWKGLKATKEFGSHCIQSVTYPDMLFHDPGPSEDCLTLNVWSPADAKKGSLLPVMVWIYGGGFAGGGTSEARQDGQFLAHRNVVVVSMNYRLGIFGFFAHPELTAESPHHASGNYGLMDQAAAIAWVKKNIAEFGGDPKNITIFGESAGSISVSAQMTSPLTKDLIAKAIGESGGAFSATRVSSREESEKADAAFAENALHAKRLAELRKVPADDLLKAAKDPANHAPRFWPNVDGYFLPEAPASIYAAGKQAHVPLLAGWNADEGRATVLIAKEKPTVASFSEQAEKEFGPDAEKFLAAYHASTDEDVQQVASDYAGDRFIAYSTWRWVEAQVKTGRAPVYRYFLDLGSPGDKFHPVAMGAFHSDDIEYVFGTLDSRQGAVWRPEDRKLSDEMQQYWTNFARTGDPNGASLSKWPAYNAAGGWMVMHLDADSAAKPDGYRERYVFLDSVWGKPKPDSVSGH